jgi:hypothetical protein
MPYTIERATFNKEVETKYGTMKLYDLTFETGEQAELMQKPETLAPTMGQTLEGTIESTQYGNRFRRLKPQNAGGGYKRDPSESKSIVRQHSQQMAIAWAVILDKKGLLPERPDYVWLKGVIDFFVEDAGS